VPPTLNHASNWGYAWKKYKTFGLLIKNAWLENGWKTFNSIKSHFQKRSQKSKDLSQTEKCKKPQCLPTKSTLLMIENQGFTEKKALLPFCYTFCYSSTLFYNVCSFALNRSKVQER